MKLRLRIAIALISLGLCIMFLDSPLYGQGRQRSGGGRRDASSISRGMAAEPEFDNRSFDITLEQLPPLYLGYNAELLYTAIKRTKEKNGKGETETDEPRQGKGGQKAALPSEEVQGPAGTYAFQYYPKERFYSGREQILHVYCELSPTLESGKEDGTRRTLMVKYLPQVDNRRTFTDAHGAKTEFEEVKFREYSVAFANFGEFPVERLILPSVKQAREKEFKKGNPDSGLDDTLKQEVILGNIPMKSSDAEQHGDEVRVLVICNLVDPYETSETVERKPAPERPSRYFAQHQYLHVRLLELWFYDFETGKVFIKMKPKEASQR